ncbi:MAG: hypothetical protein C0467_22780 [Planctomycetaceae bacterium]|nr:hypothetical protein [Planctomycetaceae bacterium]
MKSSYTAFGVVLLALTGLWYVGGGSAVPTQAAAAAEQPHVSAPVTHNNLTVFFIHGRDAVTDTHKVATLQEALEAGWAVVHETKNVNTLEVENNSSDYELFIQEGDIIKGGQQDRVFAIDMLVPPKSGRVPFPAHCVEAGRWTNRGNESATQFTKSDQRIVGNKLLYANATRQQGEVWANVKTNQDKLSEKLKTKVNAAESESSFQLTLENKNLQAKVAEFETALRTAGETRKNVVGVVFLVNGQVTGAEVYGSNAMFQKAWPRLLKSQAADAVAETTDKPLPPIPSTQEVERFLAMAGQQPAAGANNLTNADTDLTNQDVGLQTNLEAAMPDITAAQLQSSFTGRSGATRTRMLTANGGNMAQPVGRDRNPAVQTLQTNDGNQLQFQEVAQQQLDRVQTPGIANPAPNGSTSSTGNRLNVQRVEDRAGLSTESRDPARQNALIHKSFIKK